MSSKHTPGPWEAYVNNSQGYALGVMVCSGGRAGGNENLCDIRDPHGFEGGVAEAEANARLVAAAPDLLAALNELYDICLMQGGTFGMLHQKEMAQACAAIAKAESK